MYEYFYNLWFLFFILSLRSYLHLMAKPEASPFYISWQKGMEYCVWHY